MCMSDQICAMRMGWAEKEAEKECVTERNSGYFINTKSSPCVSHCPGVELSDCNTIALCYCKQDILYCYCCPSREEFSICDLQPSDREQRTQDLLIEQKFASSNRGSEKKSTIATPDIFSLHRLGKSMVIVRKDSIKEKRREKFRFFTLFERKQRAPFLRFSLRCIHRSRMRWL